MKYAVYLLLLYIFLPFNSTFDFITILLFFVIFNEHEWFALVFAFFSGLLVDLYYPTHLGLNALLFTILAQILLIIRKYIARDLVIIALTFAVFYLTKIIVISITTGGPIRSGVFIFTLILGLPIYLLMSRLFYRAWLSR